MARTTTMNNNIVTGTVQVNTWMKVTNSTFTSVNSPSRNSSQTTTVPSFSNDIVFINEVSRSDQQLRDLLESTGLDLPKLGTRLMIMDGEAVVVHTHADGSSSHHDPIHVHRGKLDLSRAQHALLPGTVIKLPNGNFLQVDKDGALVEESYVHARKDVINVSGGSHTLYESLAFCHFSEIKIPADTRSRATFELPNGVKIRLHTDDRIEVDTADGHQLYKSEPVRGFNKYLNASDLLESFIRYCAEQKVTRKEFSDLPISLFIYWLIVKAAEADGDSTDEVAPLLGNAIKERKLHKHHCKCCGRFLKAKLETHGIHFCSSEHMDRYLERISA